MPVKRNHKIIISVLLILVITSAVFLPCAGNRFTGWDDNAYVLQNPFIKHLGRENIKQIFAPSNYNKSESPRVYAPLVFLSYALEYRFFNLDPRPYHITNVALHLLNCLLVFWFILLLGGGIAVSLLTAVLFGIHPLHVEPVAWVAGRKEVLYSFFCFFSLVLYVRYLRSKSFKYFCFAFLLFGLALLSKPSAIILPIIFALLDYFINGRINRDNLRAKFILSGFLFLPVALAYLRHFSGYAIIKPAEFFRGILSVMYSVTFPLSKLVLPVNLSCLYYINETTGYLLIYGLLGFSLLAAVLFFIVKRFPSSARTIFFGTAFFLAASLPYLLMPFLMDGYAITFDRFAYFSGLGIFFLAAELFIWLLRHRKLRYFSLFLIIPLLCVLPVMSWNRCRVWYNSATLWTDVLKKYPGCPTAYNNRGAGFLADKEYKLAYSDLMKARSLNPDCAEVYFNLGALFKAENDYGRAIEFFSRALELYPEYLAAYDMLVFVYAKSGGFGEILDLSKRFIRARPDCAAAYVNVCRAYIDTGRFQEARQWCEKALAIDPSQPLAHVNLSRAYYLMKQYDLAIQHCDESVRLGCKSCAKCLEQLSPYRRIVPAPIR